MYVTLYFVYKIKSNHSQNSDSKKIKIKPTMSSQKLRKIRKKMRSHTRENIRKLFNRLRNDSSTSFENSNSNTVIVLDNSVDDGINKRKCTDDLNEKFKLRRSNSDGNLIVIRDDDEMATSSTQNGVKTPRKNFNSSPIQCSTPIINNDKTLKELNISRVSKTDVNAMLAKNLNEELTNLTKEINRDSYLTIDLTNETDPSKVNATKSLDNTVIDLVNTSDADCLFVSASNTSLSMSGDSEVTVLSKSRSKKAKDKQIKRYADGISKLNASDKGRLLEMITNKIFNGCKVPANVINTMSNVKQTHNRATDTIEDSYIKEVILGQTQSRNSIGSNIYNPEKDIKNKTGLRMIIIDGSNVAMQHGKGKMFSVKGLKICIDYFLKRGHAVKAFVPRFRCKYGKSTEPRLLDDLERQGLVVYTPSREIQGRLIASYDDRYIVQCAAEFDGVIVSGDNYRDLLQENSRWRFVIENRLLPFTWVEDMLMFPKDPLGRNGPTLEQFLRHQPTTLL